MENQSGGLPLAASKSYYKSEVGTSVWLIAKDRHMNQGSQEQSRDRPTKYCWLIFYNVAKVIQLRKNSLFNKWCMGHPYVEIWNFGPYLAMETKVNSKWIIALNIKMHQISRSKQRRKTLWFWVQQRFLRHNTKSTTLKLKNIIKVKNFCILKDTVKMKRQDINEKKISAKHMLNK